MYTDKQLLDTLKRRLDDVGDKIESDPQTGERYIMIEGARWSYIRAYEYVGGKGSYTQGLKDI
jgi:hypothetical protein